MLCALLLPPVVVTMVAAFALFSQEQAMNAAIGSYVQDLAESVASRLSVETRGWPWNTPWRQNQNLWDVYLSSAMRLRNWNRIFSWGPSIPGWVAYIGDNGEVFMSSPGAEDIAELWRKDLPVGVAARVQDPEGRQYTLAKHPLYPTGQGYVVAVVSWDSLLGKLVKIGRLWPGMIALASLGSFWAIRLLWRRLIAPLKGLAAEIDALRMGKDIPNTVNPQAVKEIESVHSALIRFAKAAVDRDKLRDRYVRDIVQVQESERLDMAREIHDGPLQDITALLQQIHILMEGDGDAAERVKKTERLARTAVRELRGLCDELAPPWVDLGLPHALTELAERMSQNYDIHVSMDVDESFELGAERTLSLLRITQEAVSNAVRHGDATEVRGQMFEKDGRLFFEIKDNGRGFDNSVSHETLRLEGHRGLANMTERMSLMNGTLKVCSTPGEGTAIICSMTRDL
ncbi:MAG: sensor histidine kinase [Synergistaceae bacterium]|nr:sensor histidine kinase [Synergistaceae bacterium]